MENGQIGISKIKTIIVDDEILSCEVLNDYISEYCPDLEVIAHCHSVPSAYETIDALNPQLVFLDIEMPEESGFDLLRKFEHLPFRVIFVTAYSQYAVDAFRFSAVDYLMKPIKIDELIDSVNKVVNFPDQDSALTKLMQLVENINSPLSSRRKLVIPSLDGFGVYKTNEIIICSADRYCTDIRLIDKKNIKSSRNLKYYEGILPQDLFMRVHHTHLINLEHVMTYERSGIITLTNNIHCPVSNTFKLKFLKVFKNEL